MFSISAINDKDSKKAWEPLAPTKEAQEFHLSQTYHEGLLQLQSKEYAKARELLESVLTDPLISGAQVESSSSDGHLLQLRFLALKNLATVFVEQGYAHYEAALHCYLQAVEIDAKDSVVWNQLGTLSCTMGLLSISRWAFEQGLYCSPNNWNCMEKLLEVLIAIGDEVACHNVAELILRHWPSHARAQHVKSTIKETETIQFAPRGIDKLKPKHVRLKFPKKRKAEIDNSHVQTALKIPSQTRELHLSEVSWEGLCDSILGILRSINGEQDQGATQDQDNTKNACEDSGRNIYSHSDTRLCIISSSAVKSAMMVTGANVSTVSSGDNFFNESSSEKNSNVKEKEVSADDEHPQERRSTRLERLRNRKPGKEDLDLSAARDLARATLQSLEPFIVGRSGTNEMDTSISSDAPLNASDEFTDVLKFINGTTRNYGALHVGHLLLEEVAQKGLSYKEGFAKLLELEKFTRNWGQDRSIECNLFIAELYYDIGLHYSNQFRWADFFLEASYHLCKIIESVALNFRISLNGLFDTETKHIDKNGDILILPDESSFCLDSVHNSPLTENCLYWVRFFWLSGRLSVFSGNKLKAYEEFCISLSLLRRNIHTSDHSIPLSHCKLVGSLTIGRLLHEIHLLKLDHLLETTTREMMDKGMNLECSKLLSPLLLSTEVVYHDLLSDAYVEGKSTVSSELLALDVLIEACEKAVPMPIDLYLGSHRRKLQLLISLTGLDYTLSSYKDCKKRMTAKTSCESELGETVGGKKWPDLIAEVKGISKAASLVKNAVDQISVSDGSTVPESLIGDIQTLLVTVICAVVRNLFCPKSSNTISMNPMEQLDSKCFIDAIIGFCKLQHLILTIPIKTQVGLIVAIHELLAEHGLCCAGKDSEGDEGAFLKLSIKHLLTLDMKIKSGFHASSKCLETMESDIKGHEIGSIVESESGVPEKEKTQFNNDSLEENVHQNFSILNMPEKNEVDTLGIKGQDSILKDTDSEVYPVDIERKEVEIGIDNALNQSFFCLYGLNLKCSSDSSGEDDLAIHKNTSRGDYHTKEQCADVFQYILPYAKASSRSGLIKLRRVLRAIRKHFPHPPDHILRENFVDKFLDCSDLSEDILSGITEFDGKIEFMCSKIFPNAKGFNGCLALPCASSEPYFEVYGNLYYFLAQAEDMTATDKLPGFVLKKEGEEFVEQNANLFKYDLLYNPLRLDSWQRLANIYDEEVDLLLNDSSKQLNVVEWRKHSLLPQRVEVSRRRSRRCFLMSLALAKTPLQKSQLHDQLALVYYDGLQNVVPSFDQRSVVPTKDATWMVACKNSMKHFEMAFALKPEWSHAFYLGKLCEKLGCSYVEVFSYYNKAITMNPTAVDPVYRLHASRIKMLSRCGKENILILKIATKYAFNQSTKDAIMSLFNWTNESMMQLEINDKNSGMGIDMKQEDDSNNLEKAWQMLYADCLSSLEMCVEGDLKHFHKARFTLAQGLYERGHSGDLEKAKDELSFCFRSTRSAFTINMWEIDSMVKKGRRRTPGLGGNKRVLEVNMPEISRKFITCIRKYILFYLNLLEKTGDYVMLDRAYSTLRTDKRFYLCLEDIVPVALGKCIEALIHSIQQTVSSDSLNGAENLLERLFNLFLDNWSLWPDIIILPEMKNSGLSENSVYCYLHEYIYLLEASGRLDILEGLNEKIRKRFRNPKLSNPNISRICKHASTSWCRSIIISLALITPLHEDSPTVGSVLDVISPTEREILLYVDLNSNEIWTSSEDANHVKDLETKWNPVITKIRSVHIKCALEPNMDSASNLMRCAYNFYRDSSYGTILSGINFYTVSSQLRIEGKCLSDMNGVDLLDLSVPRKLLIWAYVLVHGHYSNIQTVVKYCEENVKPRLKKGMSASSSIPTHTAGRKEKLSHDEHVEVENPQSVTTSSSLHGGIQHDTSLDPVSNENQKSTMSTSLLQHCNFTIIERSIKDGRDGGLS